MSFRDITQIAGSAMAAQTVRLNTVASNLANADSAAASRLARGAKLALQRSRAWRPGASATCWRG